MNTTTSAARCAAPNASGGTCLNFTGQYGGHCWLHAETEALVVAGLPR